jgi:hypothetical protein
MRHDIISFGTRSRTAQIATRRRDRKARLALEGLETRQLLSYTPYVSLAPTPGVNLSQDGHLSYGETPIEFTATVYKPSGAAIPTGTIDFSIDGTKVDTETLGTQSGVASNQAILALTPQEIQTLNDGSHTITASFNSTNSSYNSNSVSLSETVDKADTNVSLTATANFITYSADVTFNAQVSKAPDGSAPTGNVDFTVDGQKYTKSVDITGLASLTVHALGGGQHQITAIYNGDSNYNTSPLSNILSETVEEARPDTSLQPAPGTQLDSSGNLIYGNQNNFVFKVSGVPGGATPSGYVSWAIDTFDATKVMASGMTPLQNGEVTLTLPSTAAPGKYTITASYEGDQNYGGLPPSVLPVAVDAVLFDVVNDPFLARALYSTPNRMASQIAPSGAVGVNASWESGQSPIWYIEQQRYGADFVQAGLVQHDADLTRRGWQILDWGLARQSPDGGFAGTGDAFHSTSMFVEAAARALLLEKQSGAADFPTLSTQYLPKIEASVRWLTDPAVAVKGQVNDLPYADRRWLLAAALGQTAALDGDPALAAAAESYARDGLAMLTPEGILLEKNGGDVTYQGVGVLLAERYATVCTDPGLRAQTVDLINRALRWEMTRIDANGTVSIDDSTRVGQETSRSGAIKTVDYKTIVQAFALGSAITSDPTYEDVATLIATGRDWLKT